MEVATGALPSLLPKLADLLISEYKLQKEVKGGIIFLQAELESMRAALEKISEMPAEKLDNQDKIWARDVRELSYSIEDKIDAFMVRCKGSRLAEQHGLKKAIDRSLNWLMQPKIRRKIATSIRDIKSRVEEVSRRRDRYKINGEVASKSIMVDPRLLVEKTTELIGIDEARDELIKIMMEGNQVSKQQEKIISIVGFGGLGKTTLAKVVFENLKEKFKCSAFVPVSQSPDMDTLFKDMLYQLAERNNARTNVIDEIRVFLQDRRYFIVIDDIWDISVWKVIRHALPDNNRGCKIITTTRILEVAKEVGGPYQMETLSLHNSRILLYRRIFGNKNNGKCPDDELAELSDRILIKCGGVPLAVITIASLLASKGRNKLDWYEVYNSIGTGMEDSLDVKNMRKILSFSYYNLPSHLKNCLLYLSVFPEDYEIDKKRLVWIWVAEGFIQCGKQEQSLFEVGESYFNELVNRCMIQPVYDMYDMKIRSCRVHDMVLDLVRSISSEENFITSWNEVIHKGPAQTVRRLSFQNRRLSLQNYNDVDHGTRAATVAMQQVRSVVVFSCAARLIPAISRFKVVRVLHLENCDLSHGYNLKNIGKLVHLRCLGLRSAKIVELPEEIGNLQFLQTLDISNNAISTLPFTIVNLRQLKCLYIDRVNITTANRIGALTSLEELSRLRVEDSIIGSIEELGHLAKLRVLEIVYFFREREYMLVECLNKLQNLKNLHILFLERTGNLDGWVGPQNLRSLQVDGYWFSKLPVWINRSHVQNLSFLNINMTELQQEELEILGWLPALRDLCMWLSEARSNISREFVIRGGLFPCLVYCKLLGYYERVVFQLGAMPKLTRLEVHVSRAVWSEWTRIPDLGFENLPSLLDIHVGLRRGHLYPFVARARAALRNMAEIHPNHPSTSVFPYRY